MSDKRQSPYFANKRFSPYSQLKNQYNKQKLVTQRRKTWPQTENQPIFIDSDDDDACQSPRQLPMTFNLMEELLHIESDPGQQESTQVNQEPASEIILDESPVEEDLVILDETETISDSQSDENDADH